MLTANWLLTWVQYTKNTMPGFKGPPKEEFTQTSTGPRRRNFAEDEKFKNSIQFKSAVHDAFLFASHFINP